MFERTRKVISILLIAVFALCLFSCASQEFPGDKDPSPSPGGPYDDCEVYPEDMPFRITTQEYVSEPSSPADKTSISRRLASFRGDECVEKFLDYYNDEFSAEFCGDFFFVKPDKKTYCDGATINVRRPYLYKYVGPHEYDIIEYEPYISQSFGLLYSPYFPHVYGYPSKYNTVNVNIYSRKIEWTQYGAEHDFEFVCSIGWGGAYATSVRCSVNIYINGDYVAHCSVTGLKITKYAVANFLYSNYMILSPEPAEE